MTWDEMVIFWGFNRCAFPSWLISISYGDKIILVEYLLWILHETTDAVLAIDTFYAIFSEDFA